MNFTTANDKLCADLDEVCFYQNFTELEISAFLQETKKHVAVLDLINLKSVK
jgi:hypothetical protein